MPLDPSRPVIRRTAAYTFTTQFRRPPAMPHYLMIVDTATTDPDDPPTCSTEVVFEADDDGAAIRDARDHLYHQSKRFRESYSGVAIWTHHIGRYDPETKRIDTHSKRCLFDNRRKSPPALMAEAVTDLSDWPESGTVEAAEFGRRVVEV